MKSTFCAGLLGLALLAGCTQSAEQMEQNFSTTHAVQISRPPKGGVAELPQTPVSETEIAQANNTFSLLLFQKLAAEDADSNIFCSPLNVSTAFAQLYLGSAYKTTESISKTFGWKDNSSPHHQSLNAVLTKLTKKGDGPTINIANKLWLAPTFTIYPAYIERLKQFYAAELFAIDFANPAAAAQAINDWVSLKTEKKIPKLLEANQIAPNTQFIITSAIYFKADWAIAFKTENSKNETFHGRQSNEVNMMHHSFDKSAKYLEFNNTQILALPYKNSPMSAYFILPPADKPLGAFIAELKPEFFNTVIAAPSMPFDYVRTTLPSWKIEYSKSLLPTLKDMGLETKLDMAAMTPVQDLMISVVQHKAFVEVNEKGTEAAAATAVVAKSRSTNIQDNQTIYNFVANRPFIYFIADEETQTVLFVGNITNL